MEPKRYGFCSNFDIIFRIMLPINPHYIFSSNEECHKKCNPTDFNTTPLSIFRTHGHPSTKKIAHRCSNSCHQANNRESVAAEVNNESWEFFFVDQEICSVESFLFYFGQYSVLFSRYKIESVVFWVFCVQKAIVSHKATACALWLSYFSCFSLQTFLHKSHRLTNWTLIVLSPMLCCDVLWSHWSAANSRLSWDLLPYWLLSSTAFVCIWSLAVAELNPQAGGTESGPIGRPLGFGEVKGGSELMEAYCSLSGK